MQRAGSLSDSHSKRWAIRPFDSLMPEPPEKAAAILEIAQRIAIRPVPQPHVNVFVDVVAENADGAVA
jgi:hypothetical protein